MLKFKNYRDYLKHVLTKRMEGNARYSQRAFARDLDLSPGELSEILNGKRPLSLKKAKKIGSKLGLSKIECQHFDLLVSGKPPEEDLLNKSLIDPHKFSVVSDWYHFAILCLADCKDFRWSFSWISKKLGLKMIQVKEAVQNLVQVGMVQRSSDQRSLHVVPDFFLSTEDIPSDAIREFHQQILNKAKESLATVAVDQREISGVGMAIDPEELPAMKKDIAAFQEMMIEKYYSKNASMVYHLEVACIPLTTSDTRDEDAGDVNDEN